MLSRLRIQNYALIRSLNVTFSPNFNALTGETGAGKSILLGAIGLMLGERADLGSLFDRTSKCVIEGTFITQLPEAIELLKEFDLDIQDDLTLRREITPSGKSRAFINDTPVSGNQLRAIGSLLVDIHSQHQTILLKNADFQMSLVDGFAKSSLELENFRSALYHWQQAEKELQQIKAELDRDLKDRSYLEYQLQELDKASLKTGELKEAEDELKLLNSSSEIAAALSASATALYEGDQNVYGLLSESKKAMLKLAGLSENFASLGERLTTITAEAMDVYNEIAALNDSIVHDPERIDALNARLSAITALLAKHGLKTEAELIELKNSLSRRLNQSDEQSERLGQLGKEVAQKLSLVSDSATILHQKRLAAIPELEAELLNYLKEVGLTNSSVKFEFVQIPFSKNGGHRANLLFSANVGVPLADLSSAASGGELSRVMLALKAILAKSANLPSIIFDEIDTGVSGEIARRVGQLIRQISAGHQVLIITHQPQIAAMGQKHFRVSKMVSDGTTQTQMTEITNGERVEEIASMMGGAAAGTATIQSAQELLDRYKH